MRQREKEEQQKLKALQKEKEQELQRQKEREKYISPPYGIDNYGNTCYFNSVNQIFLNLPILQQLFLDQRINFFINKFNKFGHQGKFFETFRYIGSILPTAETVESSTGKNLRLKARGCLSLMIRR